MSPAELALVWLIVLAVCIGGFHVVAIVSGGAW